MGNKKIITEEPEKLTPLQAHVYANRIAKRKRDERRARVREGLEEPPPPKPKVKFRSREGVFQYGETIPTKKYPWTDRERKKVLRFIFKKMAQGKSILDMRRLYRKGNPIIPGAPFPSRWRITSWIHRFEWEDKYKLARLSLIEYYVDHTIPIAEGKKSKRDDMVSVARDKLKINTRQWIAGRVNPTDWGEMVQVRGSTNHPLEIHHSAKPEYLKEVLETMKEAGVWEDIENENEK